MGRGAIPNYAVFDDYRSSQRIAVVVRWFVLATWLTLINIRTAEPNVPYLDAMGAALMLLNGYVHWRILRGNPITWPYVLTESTARNTVSNILGKLGLRTRSELVRWAFEHKVMVGLGDYAS